MPSVVSKTLQFVGEAAAAAAATASAIVLYQQYVEQQHVEDDHDRDDVKAAEATPTAVAAGRGAAVDVQAPKIVMPAGAAVLSIEFKINLLSPAAGEHFIARGRVLRSGRTISVCQADGFAITGGTEKQIATMVGTMMCVRDNPALSG